MADRIQNIEAEDEIDRAFDASDPKQVNNARKKGARKKAERLRVVEALMQHKEGRQWLREFMESCDIFGNPMVQGDPYGTHFRLGQQNAGKRVLMDIIAASPDNYVVMMKEGEEGG